MLHPDIDRVSYRLFLVWHANQYLRTLLNQTLNIDITINLRELRKRIVDHMLALELRTVTVKPVGDEDRNVIQPGISGGSAQHDPAVVSSDLQKRLRPLTRSYQPLLVKDEESVLD